MEEHNDFDNNLVERSLNGDSKAFGELVKKYQMSIYNTVYQIVNDSDTAKDVVQVSFIKAWEKLPSFKPTFRFFSWMYRISVNEALNSRRSSRSTESITTDYDHSDTPHSQLEDQELAKQLQEAIDSLPFDQKMVLLLRYFDDLPYRDIAYILDIDETTVKSRLYSARLRLRDILKSEN
jgi:RNA polymerase sigma-70 factor (ECF subfamily)